MLDYLSSRPITLQSDDFSDGGLLRVSFVRPDKLFTADPSIVSKVYGQFETVKLNEILMAIRLIFSPSVHM
jgi:hypothetical protein